MEIHGLMYRFHVLLYQNLLELQFDCNNKFKESINEKSSAELRFLPLGRDRNGLAYWYLIVSVDLWFTLSFYIF